MIRIKKNKEVTNINVQCKINIVLFVTVCSHSCIIVVIVYNVNYCLSPPSVFSFRIFNVTAVF